MTELVTYGETPLQLSPPENQRLEMAREASIYADGMSSNAAVAARELGTDVTWLSKLPDTPLGRRVVSQIEEHGVDTDVSWSDDNALRQGLTFRESGIPPRKSQRWHDRGRTAVAASEPSDYPMNLVQHADVFFTDLSTAILSDTATETTEALLRAGSGGAAVTAIDVNYSDGLARPERYLEALERVSKHVDVFFGREEDVRTVLDRGGKPRELANVLAAEYDFDIVTITREERGAVSMHNSPATNVIHERETIDAKAVDHSGQDGAFIGAFLAELIRGADAARALSYAVGAAILTRTMRGPFLTTVDGELEAVVEAVIQRSK